MVSLDVKVLQYLVSLIFLYRFWLMFVPFRLYFDLIFTTHFLMDSFSYPIMSAFVLFLSQLTAFANDMVHRFIHLSAHSAFTFSLCLIIQKYTMTL